jgi:hypothetical protein
MDEVKSNQPRPAGRRRRRVPGVGSRGGRGSRGCRDAVGLVATFRVRALGGSSPDRR